MRCSTCAVRRATTQEAADLVHRGELTFAGVDVVEISRWMGHANPVVTLRIYAHLFNKDGSAAAAAIEVAMRTQPQRRCRDPPVPVAIGWQSGGNSGFPRVGPPC
jgi:hypothetical protein